MHIINQLKLEFSHQIFDSDKNFIFKSESVMEFNQKFK